MGLGVFIHHIGTLLLLIATALLIVADVSAPVVNHLSIMKVHWPDLGQINFGTFGWCVVDRPNGGDDICTGSHVGYNPGSIIGNFDHSTFSDAAESTAKALTNVMVLHAVATGFSFIAFLLCLGTSCIGSLTASLMAIASFIVTVIVVICDFVCWSIVKHEVNHHEDGTNRHAEYGPAIWCVLVAGCCTLLASVLVFVTCCAGRMREKRRSRHNRRSLDKY